MRITNFKHLCLNILPALETRFWANWFWAWEEEEDEHEQAGFTLLCPLCVITLFRDGGIGAKGWFIPFELKDKLGRVMRAVTRDGQFNWYMCIDWSMIIADDWSIIIDHNNWSVINIAHWRWRLLLTKQAGQLTTIIGWQMQKFWNQASFGFPQNFTTVSSHIQDTIQQKRYLFPKISKESNLAKSPLTVSQLQFGQGRAGHICTVVAKFWLCAPN